MLRRLTTAFLLAAFLGGGGGLRPDVSPRCPHHGGSGTPAGSTTHASATNASAAGAELFVAGPSARDGGDSHGASECDCGPTCHCCPGRRDGSLLAAAIPPGAPDAAPVRERPVATRAAGPIPEASPRLLPWPTGPPAL